MFLPLTRWPLLIFAFLLGLALVAAACGNTDTVALEERAQSIDKGLMCPVCPGETIDQAQVEIASQMRVIVREKLEEGWSRDEVLQFFVDRYGQGILASPPKEGFNLLVWTFPPMVFLGAGIVLFLIVRSMRRGSSDAVVSPEGGNMEEYLALADVELEGSNLLKPDDGRAGAPEKREG